MSLADGRKLGANARRDLVALAYAYPGSAKTAGHKGSCMTSASSRIWGVSSRRRVMIWLIRLAAVDHRIFHLLHLDRGIEHAARRLRIGETSGQAPPAPLPAGGPASARFGGDLVSPYAEVVNLSTGKSPG